MSKLFHSLRETLHKHTKFKVQVNENDEVACWALITTQPYRDKLKIGIKPFVVNFRRCIPMLFQIENMLYNITYLKVSMQIMLITLQNYKSCTNQGISGKRSPCQDIIKMFHKLKPLFIRPNMICDMCCCQCHIGFQLYYDTFQEFCQKKCH